MCGAFAFVGWCMLRSGQEPDEARLEKVSSPLTVLSLAFATSVDSMAIGLGLAMIPVEIFLVSAVIGLFGAGLSFAGLLLGGPLGRVMGKRCKFAGGLVLFILGLRAFVH
jgi:putative Mn2+ efflux pump MntP